MIKELLVLLGVCLPLYGKPLNVLFIVADDLGWNDIGYHNPDIKTPVLDGLARDGVKFGNAYVQPTCTPSRHALMTGTYPFRAGLQRGAFLPGSAQCSPLSQAFLPKKLQALGYSTHIVGKWHLGYCNWNCTPTYRGFDSFLGIYNGQVDYYKKTLLRGIDFRDNTEKVEVDDEYTTYIYSKRATDIINSHDVTKPLFLYMSFQNPHTPIQVPKKYEDMYSHIEDDGRRVYSGMVSAMDESIGNITEALMAKGLMEDTVIIFTSDNGGWTNHNGNNYPLRGGKLTLFEGGTRAASFIYGAGLTKTGYTYDGMIHAVDWHPTILGIAGGEADAGLDGINLWDSIRTGEASNRTEFVYNLDDSALPLTGAAAIRVGDFKLISGYPGRFRGWYQPATATVSNNTRDAELPEQKEEYENDIYRRHFLEDMENGGKKYLKFQGLFNLAEDPNERNDLSEQYPDKVKEMKEKLDGYRKRYTPPYSLAPDPRSNPVFFGGYWSPGWC